MQGDNAELPRISSSWFKRAFGELYPVVYAHRTVEAARPEAEFAASALHVRDSDALLDIGCGSGRHLVHLSNRCTRCTGLDYSADLLAEARSRLAREVFLVRADMRSIPLGCAFDVVVNFFTSFGYFFAEEDNMRVIRELARVLKPGGRFFVDYLNPAYARATLQPSTIRASEGFEIQETRWIDSALRRVNKSTRVLRNGNEVERLSESVRLYEPEEFAAMLHGAGLSVRDRFGDYSGAALADDLPRMIVTGRKD